MLMFVQDVSEYHNVEEGSKIDSITMHRYVDNQSSMSVMFQVTEIYIYPSYPISSPHVSSIAATTCCMYVCLSVMYSSSYAATNFS